VCGRGSPVALERRVGTRRVALSLLVLIALGSSSAAAAAAPPRTAILESVQVTEEVPGDVIVVGGDLSLGPGAVVHGHAVAVFGTVTVAPGARVDGRVVAVSSLANLSLTPGSDQDPLLTTAVRVLATGGWLLLTTGLAWAFPVGLRRGVRALPGLGVRLAALGAMAWVTLFGALVAALSLGPSLGVALAAALLLAALVAKTVGLAVLGGGIGRALLGLLVHRPLPLSVDVFVGVALLLTVRLVPLVGSPLWTVLSVVALGTGVFALALVPHNGAFEVSLPRASSTNR
jgi:hypothetical protein